MPPNIDPNFYTDAYNKGRENSFKYGPLAIEAKVDDIKSAKMANEFNFGEDAQEARSVETTGKQLKNSLQEMSNEQQRLDNDSFVKVNRELVTVNNQNTLTKAKQAATSLNSPKVLDAIQATTAMEVFTKQKEVEKQFADAQASIKLDQVQLTTDIANKSKESLIATMEQRQLENRSKYSTGYQNSFELDAQAGGGIRNQATYFDSLSKTDFDILKDAAPNAIPDLARVLQDPHLDSDPELKQRLTSAYSTIGYVGAQKNVSNIITGLGNTEQLSEGDAKFKNHLALTGIDFKNPASFANAAIESVADAEGNISGYSVSGPSGKTLVSAETMSNTAAGQNFLANYNTVKQNSKNPITAKKEVMDNMDAITNSGLYDSTVQTYSSLTRLIGSQDNETINALAPVMKDFQDELDRYNPFYSGELGTIVSEVDGLPLFQTGLSNKPVQKATLISDIKNNPLLKEKLISAINYPNTGGLDPRVFEAHINKTIKTITRNDPRYTVNNSDPTRSPEQVKIRLMQLRKDVKANMSVPQLGQIPKEITDALGVSEVKKPSTNAVLRSLKDLFKTQSVRNYTVDKPLPQ